MSADDTYAPKSPDLSSFYSAGPTEPVSQQVHHPQAVGSHLGFEYKEELTPYNHPSSSYNTSPVHLSNHHQQPHYDSQPHHPPPPHQPTIKDEYPNYFPPAQQQYLPSGPSQGLHPHPIYGAHPLQNAHLHQHPEPSYAPPYGEQNLHPTLVQTQAHSYAPSLDSGALLNPSNVPVTSYSSNMPPRKAAAPPAPIIEPSPVKTKFPTARIKRIMQADEEVGKVAQQTPIAVGKALELFMIQLVSKSADVAKEKGSKRVTASMLKQVVETDEQWDFLRDIVGRVENEKEGSRAKAKAESSSDEEVAEPKKRTRGGRKKKV